VIVGGARPAGGAMAQTVVAVKTHDNASATARVSNPGRPKNRFCMTASYLIAAP
jgi:hypothetical protein